MALSGVETGRDKNDIGTKLPCHWDHNTPECSQVLRIPTIRNCRNTSGMGSISIRSGVKTFDPCYEGRKGEERDAVCIPL